MNERSWEQAIKPITWAMNERSWEQAIKPITW
jgi:hypothetical protein